MNTKENAALSTAIDKAAASNLTASHTDDCKDIIPADNESAALRPCSLVLPRRVPNGSLAIASKG